MRDNRSRVTLAGLAAIGDGYQSSQQQVDDLRGALSRIEGIEQVAPFVIASRLGVATWLSISTSLCQDSARTSAG